MTILVDLLRLLAAVLAPTADAATGQSGLLWLVLFAGLAAASAAVLVVITQIVRLRPAYTGPRADRPDAEPPIELPLQSRPDAPGRRLPRAPGVLQPAA